MGQKLIVLIAEAEPSYKYTNSFCSRVLSWASEKNMSQHIGVKNQLHQVLENERREGKGGKTHSKQFMVGFWAFSQCEKTHPY